MDPNRNATGRRRLVPDWAVIVSALTLSVSLISPAAAQCEFVADIVTTPWNSLGAFTSASAISSQSAFSVDGGFTLTTFDALLELKVTGQTYRQQQPYNPDNILHARIDGEILFFNADGYVVIEVETEGVALYRSSGRFTITDAGGIYAGASGSGDVQITMQSSPYDNGAHLQFIPDPSF